MRSSISEMVNGRAATLFSPTASTRNCAANEQPHLAEVDLGNEHLVEALQHVAEVARERVEVAQVGLRDAACPCPRARCTAVRDDAVRAAPAEDEQSPPSSSPMTSSVGDVLRRCAAIFSARRCIILSWLSRLVADVAGDVRLLEAADAVLEAGRAGHGPRAGQRLRVARVRLRTSPGRSRSRARSWSEVAVARDAATAPSRCRGSASERKMTGVRYLIAMRQASIAIVKQSRRRGRRDDRDRRFAVAAEHHLQQVGLLRLRRHAGAGPGALHVDDDQRQLHHHRQADAPRSSAPCRGRSCRSAPSSRRSRADGGADGGDLVLGLEASSRRSA